MSKSLQIPVDAHVVLDNLEEHNPSKIIKTMQMSKFANVESFYVGDIKIADIFLDNPYHRDVYNYFNYGIYWTEEKANLNDYALSFIFNVERYTKIIFLMNEYNTNKCFNHPITVHYNPRRKEPVIHPGTGRITAAALLDNKIYSYYFSTRGIKPKFIKNMKIIAHEEVITENSAAFIVPDHGTFIPHISFNTVEQVRLMFLKQHSILQEMFLKDNYKIHSNVNLSNIIPEKFLSKFKADINITVYQELTKFELAKALFLMHLPYEIIETPLFTIEKNYGSGSKILKI